MRKINMMLIILCLFLVGCSKEEDAVKIGEWEESASIIREVIVTDDGQVEDFVFHIGNNGKFGIGEYGPFIAGEAQKYMWHFWGEQELLTKPLKVIGLSKETKEEVILFQSPGGYGLAPNTGADHSLPSLLTIPNAGLWKLLVYFDDDLFGDMIVEVSE